MGASRVVQTAWIASCEREACPALGGGSGGRTAEPWVRLPRSCRAPGITWWTEGMAMHTEVNGLHVVYDDLSWHRPASFPHADDGLLWG